MLTTVLYVDRGVVFALPKCRVCGQKYAYPAAEVIDHPPFCKSCGRAMDIEGTVIAARKERPRAGVLQPGEGTVDAN